MNSEAQKRKGIRMIFRFLILMIEISLLITLGKRNTRWGRIRMGFACVLHWSIRSWNAGFADEMSKLRTRAVRGSTLKIMLVSLSLHTEISRVLRSSSTSGEEAGNVCRLSQMRVSAAIGVRSHKCERLLLWSLRNRPLGLPRSQVGLRTTACLLERKTSTPSLSCILMTLGGMILKTWIQLTMVRWRLMITIWNGVRRVGGKQWRSNKMRTGLDRRKILYQITDTRILIYLILRLSRNRKTRSLKIHWRTLLIMMMSCRPCWMIWQILKRG